MPLINIQMLSGRTIAQKKKLVELVTKVVCDSIDTKPEKVRIIIDEMQKENYGINGKLLADD